MDEIVHFKEKTGIVRLWRCIMCNCYVREREMVWKRSPEGLDDRGVRKQCIFCETGKGISRKG